MLSGSPKLGDGYPSPISSRDSFSSGSEDTGSNPILRPRHNTFSSSAIRSSLSIEVLNSEDSERALPAHPLGYLVSGRLTKPGQEDKSGWKLIRQRASWSKAFPRPSSSRSEWPSSSTRDLLREAGEWLDAKYPAPDVQIPDTDWHLASSPLRKDFSASSLQSSRPQTPSTTTDEGELSNEKIVYDRREIKLRELLESMQRDHDLGLSVSKSRESRIRKCLKELQGAHDKRACTPDYGAQEPVEMDATERQGKGNCLMKLPSSGRSGSNTHVSNGNPKGPQLLQNPLSNQKSHQSLTSIDLDSGFDYDLSAAVAQALNISYLSDLEKRNSRDDHKSPEAPSGPSGPKAESIDSGGRSHLPVSIQSQKLSPELTDQDLMACTFETANVSALDSSSKFKPDSIIESSRELPTNLLPLPRRPSTHRTVFNDLENLARASRSRLQP